MADDRPIEQAVPIFAPLFWLLACRFLFADRVCMTGSYKATDRLAPSLSTIIFPFLSHPTGPSFSLLSLSRLALFTMQRKRHCVARQAGCSMCAA